MILEHKISNLKNEPAIQLDPALKRQLKHELLAEMNRRQDVLATVRLSAYERMRLFAFRAIRKTTPTRFQVAALMVIFVFMTSTAFMAEAAVPGDILWPVKITLEKAEVVLAAGSAEEGRVHIKHVDNRLKELNVVLQKSKDDGRKESISQLMRRLEKDITAANQSLKVAQEEDNTNPDIASNATVALLAKDLSAKATEAVKLIDDNKDALVSSDNAATSIATTSGTGTTTPAATVSTSTDAMHATGTPAGTAKADDQSAVAKVIDEVKQVNQNISYSALGTMIQVIEQGRATNRNEVTAILKSKVDDQKQELASDQRWAPRIGSNFLLHRAQAQKLVVKITASLAQADAMASLDNLSGGLQRALESRDSLDQLNKILAEVKSGKGFDPEPIVKKVKVLVPKPVTIQTIVATDTATTTDEYMLDW